MGLIIRVVAGEKSATAQMRSGVTAQKANKRNGVVAKRRIGANAQSRKCDAT